MASCQGVAEICTRLAHRMAGVEFGFSWKAALAPLRAHSAPAELTLCPGLCQSHSVLLWLHPALQEGHLHVSDCTRARTLLPAGVRPEAAELCCGLGSPAPAVPPLLMGVPEVRAMGSWNPCDPVGDWGVLTASSALSAHGESQVQLVLPFEKFSVLKRVQG